jgi:hypothetical protein
MKLTALWGWLMNSPMTLMGIAATTFACWPYPLDKAGLKDYDSPAAFTLLQGIPVLIFLCWLDLQANNMRNAGTTLVLVVAVCGYAYMRWNKPEVRWDLLALACTLSCIGLVCLSRSLTVVSDNPEKFGARSLYIATLVMGQMMVSIAIYLTFNPKEVTVVRIIGLVQALMAVTLVHFKGNR